MHQGFVLDKLNNGNAFLSSAADVLNAPIKPRDTYRLERHGHGDDIGQKLDLTLHQLKFWTDIMCCCVCGTTGHINIEPRENSFGVPVDSTW